MSTETADPPKLELPEKTVQEIVLGREEVPERYMLRDAADLHPVSAMDCPLIDLSLLTSAITRSTELEKLRSALSSWGFFQIMNHGVERKMMDQVRELSKQFFAMPKQEKQRYSRDVHLWEGYGNDAVYEDQSINWNDRLHLRVFPESQRNLKLWPQNPPTFRELLEEYATKTRSILETLVKAMAASLDLDENAFLASFGDEKKILMFARFNYYPACPAPEQMLGLRPHSDGTALTMVSGSCNSRCPARQCRRPNGGDEQWRVQERGAQGGDGSGKGEDICCRAVYTGGRCGAGAIEGIGE